MNVVLAGSMSFASKMNEVKTQLEGADNVATMPIDGGDLTPDAIRGYNDAALERIRNADFLIVINEKKHDIEGYVGANTLVEIGMAYALNTPIYLLNKYDTEQANAVELAGLIDGIIDKDVTDWLEDMKEKK